jgi:hypothetical protein
MCAKSKPILEVELIPSTCHFSNVRTTVTTKEWDKIRHISYEAAGHVCEICKDTGKNQGYKHNVECHEIWKYDDKKHIQKLIGLISLCPTCHQVKHIGRAIAIGKQNEAIGQLLKVNKWTPEEAAAHIAESFELYKERSKYQWKLDISTLKKEPYLITIKETKTRIFEVKKYKKKRKVTAKKVVKKPTKRPPKK